MDDKLRSEVMDDIEEFVERGVQPFTQAVANRYRQVMTDYEHLETQFLVSKLLVESLLKIADGQPCESDFTFIVLSHAKAFLEENDGSDA